MEWYYWWRVIEQSRLNEQCILIKHDICREPFHAWGRRCSKTKSMFHFPADGLRNTAGRANMHTVWSSMPSLEEVISSPAKQCILWVGLQEASPSLHSCSTSRCSLWQEGPVLAACPYYHFLASLVPVSPTIPKLTAKLPLLRTALWWLLAHSAYLWPQW